VSFLHHGRARSTHLLEWRVRIFVVASVLALAGMALAWRWMIWVAVGLLLVGFVMRWIPPPDGSAGKGYGDDRDTPA